MHLCYLKNSVSLFYIFLLSLRFILFVFAADFKIILVTNRERKTDRDVSNEINIRDVTLVVKTNFGLEGTLDQYLLTCLKGGIVLILRKQDIKLIDCTSS